MAEKPIRRIRPLTGQVLIYLLPLDDRDGHIILPDIAQDGRPTESDPLRKRKPRQGRVLEIGSWPKTRNGLSMLPPFAPGATVIVSAYAGNKLNRNIGEHFALVAIKDILAVLTEAEG